MLHANGMHKIVLRGGGFAAKILWLICKDFIGWMLVFIDFLIGLNIQCFVKVEKHDYEKKRLISSIKSHLLYEYDLYGFKHIFFLI